MRIKLLFCFFIITISAGAQTSVYHPFPNSNAVWTVQTGCCQCCCNSVVVCCYITNKYEIDGDTIIAGRTYHKIKSLGTYSCNPISCSPCMYPDWEMHYIREDTSKRIWMLETVSMTDVLLYDFNLNIGDTISTLLSSSSIGAPHIVQSIDSMLIGANYRKTYFYSSNLVVDTCTQFLIEGIGTAAGLFSPLCGNGCFEQGFQLSCFKQSGIALYSTCYIDTGMCNTLSVSDIKSENTFSLFPNPATSELIVRGSEFGDIEFIEIYSAMGKKVFSTTVPPFSPWRRGLGDEAVINISLFTSGIYFVILKTEKGTLTKKFIKQ